MLTIKVHPGTYTEQVVITTNYLMLMGIGSPTITVLPGTTRPIVHVWGATDVSIVGFEINGAGNGLAGSPSPGNPATDKRFYGIRYSNASGTVRNKEVHGIKHPSGHEGAQSGIGIYAFASDVGIFDNTVYDYQKIGILALLAGYSRIHDNTVTGWGPTAFIAQNGIQVGYGGHASVKDNTVTDNWYAGAGWSATGVLIIEGDNSSITGNVVNANQIGVVISSWGWWQVSADNNTVTNNTISNSDVGVSIVARHSGTVGNNIISNNEVSNTGGDGIRLMNSQDNTVEDNEVSDSGRDGIALYGDASNNEVKENEVEDSGRYGISLRCDASNNEVKENEVEGSGSFDLHWDGTGTGNVWEDNVYLTRNF